MYRWGYDEVLRATTDHGFEVQAVSGYNWLPFSRLSDSALVIPAARIERALRLDRRPTVSPWILVSARKVGWGMSAGCPTSHQEKHLLEAYQALA
jgi:hypothetical protein